MACSWIRVDTTDQTLSPTGGKRPCMIHAEDRSELFFLWNEDNNAAGLTTSEIHFRRMNTETHAFSSDITVESAATAPNGNAYMVRLDNGKLVAMWGNGSSYAIQVKAAYSTDHGDTWTAVADLTMPVANMNPIAFATDGTDAWALGMKVAGGGDTHDIWAFKYTASTNSWSVGTKVFDSGGIGGTPGTFEFTYGTSEQRRMIMLSSTVGMMIGARCEDGGTDAEKKISILRTSDGWATASVIDVEHYLTADDGGGHSPVIGLDDDGRLVAAWVFAPSGATSSMNCVVAYSDDDGVTWTVTGVPTAISDSQAISSTQFRPSIEPALYLHPDGRTFLTTMGVVSSDPARTYRYRKFYGSETTQDNWSVNDCTLDWNSDGLQVNTLYVTSVDVTPFGIYMAVGAETQVGGFQRIYLLLDTSFTTGGGDTPPGPPAPQPSPTGADENNIYVRKVLGPNSGGWSVHTYGVTCWMPWDEGDADAGREVPILTAGGEVWPQIQDPALVGIINRIEAPDLYSARHYVFSGGENQAYDPLSVYIESKHFDLDGPHNLNVVRAIYLAYRRSGDPFTAELWVDGKMVKTYEFADTQGKLVEKFRAVPRAGNVGNQAWLRVRDESVFPLIIDSMEFVYIKKGRRGNRG